MTNKSGGTGNWVQYGLAIATEPQLISLTVAPSAFRGSDYEEHVSHHFPVAGSFVFYLQPVYG